jgi:hypothetical protein
MALAARCVVFERKGMDPKSGKPLFVNPFAIWTDLALKTGAAMIASAHAVAAEAKARRVAVIPTADAPVPDAKAIPSKAAPARAPKTRRKAKGRIKARAKRR